MCVARLSSLIHGAADHFLIPTELKWCELQRLVVVSHSTENKAAILPEFWGDDEHRPAVVCHRRKCNIGVLAKGLVCELQRQSLLGYGCRHEGPVLSQLWAGEHHRHAVLHDGLFHNVSVVLELLRQDLQAHTIVLESLQNQIPIVTKSSKNVIWQRLHVPAAVGEELARGEHSVTRELAKKC